jgi:hypothetical protein
MYVDLPIEYSFLNDECASKARLFLISTHTPRFIYDDSDIDKYARLNDLFLILLIYVTYYYTDFSLPY